jgi:ribonucleoside-diphosphate reductase alpha chain
MMAWDLNNEEYLNLIAVMQIFIDQSLSTNQWYDLTDKPGRILSGNKVKMDMLRFWKRGGKSLYYLRTRDKLDSSDDIVSESKFDNCSSGACAI